MLLEKMERIILIIPSVFCSALSLNDSIRENYDETQNTLRMPVRAVRIFPLIMKQLTISCSFVVV